MENVIILSVVGILFVACWYMGNDFRVHAVISYDDDTDTRSSEGNGDSGCDGGNFGGDIGGDCGFGCF